MKFLRNFETKAEVDAAVYDEDNTPNVSYCEEDDSVKYTEKILPPPPPAWMDMVDLGLPSGTLWAKANLGANAPEEYGDYYMWGSLTPNTNNACNWMNAPFNNGSSSYNSSYFNKHKSEWLDGDILKPEYDVAHQATNGAMRMPTSLELYELITNTTTAWTTENGVYGTKFTNNSDSSKYIFIPASGYRDESSFKYKYDYGFVWSSSCFTASPNTAFAAYFTTIPQSTDSYQSIDTYQRCYGLNVRGVC